MMEQLMKWFALPFRSRRIVVYPERTLHSSDQVLQALEIHDISGQCRVQAIFFTTDQRG